MMSGEDNKPGYYAQSHGGHGQRVILPCMHMASSDRRIATKRFRTLHQILVFDVSTGSVAVLVCTATSFHRQVERSVRISSSVFHSILSCVLCRLVCLVTFHKRSPSTCPRIDSSYKSFGPHFVWHHALRGSQLSAASTSYCMLTQGVIHTRRMPCWMSSIHKHR
jgi:hypothetical protein